MGSLPPRAVVVRRETAYEALVRRHGTHQQAAFYLASVEQTIGPIMARHRAINEAEAKLRAAVPLAWRRASVKRQDLDAFLFEPDAAALGPDFPTRTASP